MRKRYDAQTDKFYRSHFNIGPAARPRTVIEISYDKAFELRSTSPLPAMMKPGLLRFRVGDIIDPNKSVDVGYSLRLVDGAEANLKRVTKYPISFMEMVPKGSRLLTAEELGRLFDELGRVLTALLPLLLTMGLLRIAVPTDETGRPGRHPAIGLAALLATLVPLGLLATFVMTDRWLYEDAPEGLRTEIEEMLRPLDETPGYWDSIVPELAATLAMAIASVPLSSC